MRLRDIAGILVGDYRLVNRAAVEFNSRGQRPRINESDNTDPERVAFKSKDIARHIECRIR